MNKILIGLVLAFLIVPSIGLAYATQQVCIDDYILEKNTTAIVSIDNDAIHITISRNISCQFGCVNNTDSGTNQQDSCKFGLALNLSVFAIFFAILVLMLALGIYFKNYIFYFMSATIFIFMGFMLLWSGLDVEGLLYQNIYTWSFGFILIGVGIYFLIKSTLDMIKYKFETKEGMEA